MALFWDLKKPRTQHVALLPRISIHFAELGAAFMCAAFGISTEPRADHAKYVSFWLAVLNRDPKAVFTAASKAQEAFEHLAYLATRNEPTE